MPTAMAEVGVTELGGKIYVIGGSEREEGGRINWASRLNMIYDPASDRWTKGAPLPLGLSHVGVAALGGRIYAVAGFRHPVHLNPQVVAFSYEPKADKWSQIPILSSPRGSVAVAAVDRKIHVFGGRLSDQLKKLPTPPSAPDLYAGFNTINTHQVYDPATERWSDAAPIPGPPRDHMGIAVLEGKIHLIGGRTADTVDNIDRHDVYDPKKDSWTAAAPLPRARSAGAATVWDGKLIYAGGECKTGADASRTTFEDVTAYDPKNDRWSDLPPLQKPRHAFGAATVGRIAYFIGGATGCGGGTLTDVLALTGKSSP